MLLKVLAIFSILMLSLSAFIKNANSEDFVGYFDYTNPVHVEKKLPIVHKYHFNSDVENLTSGLSNAFPGKDIEYVLRVFPNHHRALIAMARLWDKVAGTHQPPMGVDPKHTPEFYFKRAIKFWPKDGQSYHLYAIYLHKHKKYDLALKNYLKAKDILNDSAELSYNLGLLYYDLKQYDKSYKLAKSAYKGGYPLKGLKLKLKRKGKWK